MSGAFAPVDVDLNAKGGRLTPREWVACVQTPLPSGKILRGGGSLQRLRMGRLSIWKSPLLLVVKSSLSHPFQKAITRVVSAWREYSCPARTPCQMISMMSIDFLKYVISHQSAQHVTKTTKDVESYVNFREKKVKASCFFTWLFKNLFYNSGYILCMWQLKTRAWRWSWAIDSLDRRTPTLS